MKEDNKITCCNWNVIILIVCLLIIFGFCVITAVIMSGIQDAKFAESGSQQCRVDGHIL